MIHVTRLTHAYRQAPWRIQRQWAGAFLLGMLMLAMISALYLDVTAQAAILGREIQYLRADTSKVEHANADMQTRLASLLSANNMEQRALALGFRPAKVGEMHYLVVPGYAPATSVNLGNTTPPPNRPVVPSAYSQSLLEWVAEYLNPPATGIAGGVLP